MSKKNPAKKSPWRRMESWSHLKKTLVFGGLGLSNLAVFGLALGVYLQSGGAPAGRFFSEGQLDRNFEKISQELKKECEKSVQKVQENGGMSYCHVKLVQRYGKASYTVRPRFVVSKESGKIVIRNANSKIESGTKFAEQAEGKYGCQNECDIVSAAAAGLSLTNFMENFIEKAEDEIYESMRENLKSGKEEYKSLERERKAGLRKERNCEGDWDDEEKAFTEFDFSEQMSCEKNRLAQVHPAERDRYYYQRLQPRLWEAVRSEDGADLESGFWDEFNNPYQYSYSVRASTGLLRRYNDDWRDTFSGYEDEAAKRAYLRAVRHEAADYLKLLPKEHAAADLYSLNRGFKGYEVFRQDYSRPGSAGSARRLIERADSLY